MEEKMADKNKKNGSILDGLKDLLSNDEKEKEASKTVKRLLNLSKKVYLLPQRKVSMLIKRKRLPIPRNRLKLFTPKHIRIWSMQPIKLLRNSILPPGCCCAQLAGATSPIIAARNMTAQSSMKLRVWMPPRKKHSKAFWIYKKPS